MHRASAISRGELLRDDIHPAQANGKECERRKRPHGDAHNKAEDRNRDADEHNQAVVRPMQPPSHLDEPGVEQIDPDEEQQPPDDRHREEFQDPAPEEQGQR